MTALLHSSISIAPFCAVHLHEARTERQRCGLRILRLPQQPFFCPSLLRTKMGFLHQKRFKDWSFLEVGEGKYGILAREERWRRRRKRVVWVKSNKGFGFNGGGGRDNGGTVRLLGNLALAIGLTYLSVTGQIGLLFDAIGWVFDLVLSLSILAVILPIAGLGAFLWWAGRDIIQDSCPNCGNDFKIFRSGVKNDFQLCPFCAQPFSVEGDKFVSYSVDFSKKSTTFGEAFNNFSSPSSDGRDLSSGVVDVEAEVKDLD